MINVNAIRAILFLACVAIGHGFVLFVYPQVVMGAAMKKVSADGARLNQMIMRPLATNESRTIVRPSPDLLYSICVFDLSDGPVEFHMAQFSNYQSLSFFDARTNNFFVLNDKDTEGAAGIVVLVPPNFDGRMNLDSAEFIKAPSRKGIALVRRLAGTEPLLDEALRVQRGDYCERQGLSY